MISLVRHPYNVRNLTNAVIPATRRIKTTTKSAFITVQTWLAQEGQPFEDTKEDEMFLVHLDISEHQDKLFFVSGYPFKTGA